MTYPTTVHFCTMTGRWALVADLPKAKAVAHKLAGICPAARRWDWHEVEIRLADSNEFRPAAMVLVDGGYQALLRRLSAKLPVRRYDMTLLIEQAESALAERAYDEAFAKPVQEPVLVNSHRDYDAEFAEAAERFPELFAAR